MGAELAKLAAHVHRGLDGNAFKVLNRMAWTALDRPNAAGRPARLYFGGWEPLAMAMGHDVPADDGTSETRRVRKKASDYVTTAVGKLVAAGAIEGLVEKPRAGTRQTYRLLFDLVPQSVGGSSTPLDGGLSTPLDGGQEPPAQWGESPPLAGVPRKEQDSTEDLDQDSTPPGGLSSHGGRDPLEPHRFPDGSDECDRCTLPSGNSIHRAAS